MFFEQDIVKTHSAETFAHDTIQLAYRLEKYLSWLGPNSSKGDCLFEAKLDGLLTQPFNIVLEKSRKFFWQKRVSVAKEVAKCHPVIKNIPHETSLSKWNFLMKLITKNVPLFGGFFVTFFALSIKKMKSALLTDP